MNLSRRSLCILALAVLAFGLGVIAERQVESPAEAQAPRPAYEYRVLQDRELSTEATAARKEELQEKLNKLGAEGWEMLSPSAFYAVDKGFSVMSGPPLPGLVFQDRRAVLLLRRERR